MKSKRPRLVKDTRITKAPKGSPMVTSEQVHAVEHGDPMVALAERVPISPPLPPPNGYASWVDYAVATMDTRELYHDHLWGHQPKWPKNVTRQDFEKAAAAELAHMRFLISDPMGALANSAPANFTPPEEQEELDVVWSVGRRVFTSDDAFNKWLSTPAKWAGGKTPASTLKTKKGRNAAIGALNVKLKKRGKSFEYVILDPGAPLADRIFALMEKLFPDKKKRRQWLHSQLPSFPVPTTPYLLYNGSEIEKLYDLLRVMEAKMDTATAPKRKRILLPEFKKMMSRKPGNDVLQALDEDRGDR